MRVLQNGQSGLSIFFLIHSTKQLSWNMWLQGVSLMSDSKVNSSKQILQFYCLVLFFTCLYTCFLSLLSKTYSLASTSSFLLASCSFAVSLVFLKQRSCLSLRYSRIEISRIIMPMMRTIMGKTGVVLISAVD